jgi:2-iminobutanoate/2-iminopropanoate deaminase
MQGEALQPDGMAVPQSPYSPVVVTGDLVLLSGQVAFDADGNLVSDEIEAQARQVFDNMGRCLAAAGCGFEDVVKVNGFLADLGDFDVYNAVYREYFSPPYPVRTTVEAGLAPGLRIEVEAIARRKAG